MDSYTFFKKHMEHVGISVQCTVYVYLCTALLLMYTVFAFMCAELYSVNDVKVITCINTSSAQDEMVLQFNSAKNGQLITYNS